MELFIHQRKAAEFYTNHCTAQVLNEALNCEIITYPKIENPLNRIFLSLLVATRSSVAILSGKRLVYQFPPKIEVIPTILISQAIGRKPIAIVHDLDYLRKIQNLGLRAILDSKGFRMLRNSLVILHRGRMWELLVQNQIYPQSPINFWPHFICNQASDKAYKRATTDVKPVLVYAGNLILEKCAFLTDMGKLKRPVTLYGNASFEIRGNQISIELPFEDAYPPSLSTPALGLIWDGDSIEQLRGVYGDYQRINLPAKMSLYLAMGIPVVVSSDSNMADFVRISGIGICVNNLYEIPLTFSKEAWNSFLESSEKFGEQVRSGDDLVLAIEKVFASLQRNKLTPRNRMI